MLNILVAIGTRPEAIKLAPTILEFQKYPKDVNVEVCVTAQHRALLDDVLINFEITPNYDLDLMSKNQTLDEIFSRSLAGISEILRQKPFDWILVQGDTSTALSAALSGFYNGVRVAHVEAGLRTYNKLEPYPEEINRQLISKITDLHFAPTLSAKSNLVSEGISNEDVIVTGNTVIDALRIASSADESDHVKDVLKVAHLNNKIIMVTAHRRENFGRPLESICEALKSLASKYTEDIHVIYPVHPNPNVQSKVYKDLQGIKNISLIDPLNYFDFIQVLKHCFLIITDSGGIQEEAPTLKTPVFILRNQTERTEGVEKGVGLMLGTDKTNIINQTSKVIEHQSEYQKYIKQSNPYGDGLASQRIVSKILHQPFNEFVEI
ncbi:MAG: non-hydrolyzing UDP-N-acetylglucosamine 2-epimerase [Dehalococcoidia bacterium]